MELIDVVERLLDIDKAVFFDNPYIRARRVPEGDIVSALENFDEDSKSDEVRMLFLLDYSREVKTMAENFGSKITDKQAADRAEKFWSENFEKAD